MGTESQPNSHHFAPNTSNHIGLAQYPDDGTDGEGTGNDATKGNGRKTNLRRESRSDFSADSELFPFISMLCSALRLGSGVSYVEHDIRSQIRWSDFCEARETVEVLELDAHVQGATYATFVAFDRCAELGVVDGLIEQELPAEIGREIQRPLIADHVEVGHGFGLVGERDAFDDVRLPLVVSADAGVEQSMLLAMSLTA